MKNFINILNKVLCLKKFCLLILLLFLSYQVMAVTIVASDTVVGDTVKSNLTQTVSKALLNVTQQMIDVKLGSKLRSLVDEEDIMATNASNGSQVLRFADRKYNPAIFSGKGYKIIRKHILHNKNVLRQEDFDSPNTIYLIQYDFDLNGKTIRLPQGCTLKFDGGSFANGTLYGNMTMISAMPYCIFKQVDFLGTYSIEESYPEWLGAVGNGKHDDTEALQSSLDYFGVVKLSPNKNYFISRTLNFAFRRSLIGSNNTTISANGSFKLFNVGYNTVIRGFNVALSSPQTVISITSEHIAKSYYDYDTSADAWKYRQDANVKISDLRIISKSTVTPSKDVYCIESLANGKGTGFWQIDVENIYIYGRYKYAIYISNAKALNAKEETWQTDQIWKNIKINYALNGIYIGNGNVSSANPKWNAGNILFNNVSMQYIEKLSEHFAVLEDCNYVTFDTCIPWDWPNSRDEYQINPNKASGIAIINSSLKAQGSNFTMTEIPVAPNSVPMVTSAVDSPVKSSYDIGYFNPNLSKKCTSEFIQSLPSGLYVIPCDERYNVFFGIDRESMANMGFGPNLMSLEHTRNNMVLLTFYCVYDKGLNSIGYCIVSGDDKGDIKDIIFTNPKIENYADIESFKHSNLDRYKYMGYIKDKNNTYKVAYKIDGQTVVDAMGRTLSEMCGTEFPQIPNQFYNNGKSFYRTDKNKMYYFSNSQWFDMDGNPADAINMGTTAQRPQNVKAGFYYFDTSLNKPIWKKTDHTSEWVDANGNVV